MVSPCPVEMAVIQESAEMDNLVDVQENFVLKKVKENLSKPQHNIRSNILMPLLLLLLLLVPETYI